MKNVIASHKELQVNIFYAFTAGMQERGPLGPDKDLHVIAEVTDTDLQWRVMQHPTVAGSASSGQLVHEYRIPSGFSQLNDIRLGVITSYLRTQSQRFLEEVSAKFNVEPETV